MTKNLHATKVFRPSSTKQAQSFWPKIGLVSRGTALFDQLHSGFPYDVYHRLTEASGFDKSTFLKAVSIPPATLARRARDGFFTTEESDRIFRFAEIYKAAEDLFEGDKVATCQWLSNVNRGLGNKVPLEMLKTSAQTDAVKQLIDRLEHGVIV